MNRDKAEQVLNVYGKPSFKVGETNFVLARQTEKSLNEIESKTDEELIEHWKSLVWINMIYGQVSLNDLQRIDLLELEMEERNIQKEPLKDWYESESAKFDEAEQF